MEALDLVDKKDVDFFRFVEGHSHDCEPADGACDNTRKSARLLAVSSRFGYAFGVFQDSITVYKLGDVRDSEPLSTVAKTTLNRRQVLAVDLIRNDTVLLISVQSDDDPTICIPVALDVNKLLGGQAWATTIIPASIQMCSNFTVYLPQSGDELLAILTPERHIKLLNISQTPARVLWTAETGSIESQAPVSLAFSINGSALAAGTRRGSVQLFEVRSGKYFGTIKEVESGWTPTSLAYVADDSLLVCYQNNEQLNHVVWRLDEGTVTGNSSLDEIFYLDDSVVGNSTVHMLCKRIRDWNMCILANSCSEDFAVIARDDETNGWVQWELGEGAGASLPLLDDDSSPYPIGIDIDYTDMTQIPSRIASQPLRNPMPRVIALTSTGKLWSAMLVDDRPNAKCDAIADPISISEADIVDSKPFDFSQVAHGRAESAITEKQLDRESHGTEASKPVTTLGKPPAFGSFGGKHPTLKSTLAGSSIFSKQSGPGAFFGLFGKPTETSSFSSNTNPVFGQGSTKNETETKNVFHFKPVTNGKEFLSTFKFGQSTDTTDTRTQSTAEQHEPLPSFDALAPIVPSPSHGKVPDMSVSIESAENDDPAHQVKSMLVEMAEELRMLYSARDDVFHSVNRSCNNIETNVMQTKQDLTNLLTVAQRSFARQSESRKNVNMRLKEIIENGQNFEELSLLNTLLTEHSDARPLSKDVQQLDSMLGKKEATVVELLNSIERKLEDDGNLVDSSRRKWRTQSEVSQHIYSSLSLQGVRINRVRAILDALSSQLDSSRFASNERRVTDLGLSLSRLERLSLHTSSSPLKPACSTPSGLQRLGTPGSTSAKKPPLSGQRSAPRSTPRSRQGYLSASRLPFDDAFEIQLATIRQESAQVLRKLAMRKGRDRIEVNQLAPSRVSSRASQPDVVGAVERKSENAGSSISDKPYYSTKPVTELPAPSGFSGRTTLKLQQRPPVPESTTSTTAFPRVASPKFGKGSFSFSSAKPESKPTSAFDAKPLSAQDDIFSSSTTTKLADVESSIVATEQRSREDYFSKPKESGSFGSNALFAALPPDPEEEEEANKRNKKSAQKGLGSDSTPIASKPTTGGSLFAALPRDPDPVDPARKPHVGHKASSTSVALPDKAKDGSFAAMPPDPEFDTNNDEEARPRKSANFAALPPEPEIFLKEEKKVTFASQSTDSKSTTGGSADDGSLSASQIVSEKTPSIVASPTLAPSAQTPQFAALPPEPAEAETFAAPANNSLPITFGLPAELPKDTSQSAAQNGVGNSMLMDAFPQKNAVGKRTQVMGSSGSSSEDEAPRKEAASVPFASTFGSNSQSAGSSSAFGSSSAGLFGSHASFGSSAGQSSSIFDANKFLSGTETANQANSSPAPSPFVQFGSGGGSSFGQATSTPPQNNNQMNMAGASALGSRPTASFGAPSKFGLGASPTASFGQPSAFGTNTSNSAGFGSPFSAAQPQSAPLFGGQSGGFGSASQGNASPFAGVAGSRPVTFGGGGNSFSQTGFGSAQGGQSPFGSVMQQQQSQNAFGSGQGQISGFGQLAQSGNGFGRSGGGAFGQGAQSQSNQFLGNSFTQRRA